MGKNKNKVKEIKYVSDEAHEIKRMIIILVGVVIAILGIYFLSQVIVNKRDASTNETNTSATEINYSIVNVGMILNRPYTNYYVVAYNSESLKAAEYSMIITKYQNKEDSIKVYFCDLSNSLNKDYVAQDGKTNKNAKNINDLRFGEITLLKINNGQITSYIEDFDEIKKVLQ